MTESTKALMSRRSILKSAGGGLVSAAGLGATGLTASAVGTAEAAMEPGWDLYDAKDYLKDKSKWK
jgi:hypothetical protein